MELVRQGVVYIAESLERERLDDPDFPEFRGHWELNDQEDTIVKGPGWRTAEDAIEWGKARAPEVYIKLGAVEPQIDFSAGDPAQVEDGIEETPRWPPTREQLEELHRRQEDPPNGVDDLSEAARLIEHEIERRGASTPAEILRDRTQTTESED